MNARLLILADLGNIKAYKADLTPLKTPHLDLIDHQIIEDAHGRVVDKVTDLAGRRSSPVAKDWGSPTADDHNLILETKRRIVKQIASHIKRIAEANGFSHIWIAAHKEIINMILDELPQNIRGKVELHLARDLTKAPMEKLLKYFGGLILETIKNQETEQVQQSNSQPITK